MTTSHLDDLRNNELLRKRLAKFMTYFCFRSTKLEHFHDRINDEEMKALMIDVVNHSFLFLSAVFSSNASDQIFEILKEGNDLPREWRDWNDPEIPDELVRGTGEFVELLAARRAERLGTVMPPPVPRPGVHPAPTVGF
jgi:hypothetical protein